MYVAQNDRPRVLYRVENSGEIVSTPGELGPYLFMTSRNGYLNCLEKVTGTELWRLSTEYPIVERPAIIGNRVYVASDRPALIAADTRTGKLLWSVAGATRFVTEGAQHVYGMDRYGTLLILDKESGGVVGRLATGEGTTALVNDESDQIFLVDDRGLVQCLREQIAKQPTYYRLKTEESEDGQPEDTTDSPFAEPAPTERFSPSEPAEDFGGGFQPAEEEDTEDNAFEDDENPFF